MNVTGQLSRSLHFADTIVIAFLLITPTSAGAQTISVGIRSYAQMTDTVVPDQFSNFSGLSPSSHPYSIGPTVEVGLPRGFAIQLDAIRSRLEYSQQFSTVSHSNFFAQDTKDHTAGHSWQFPLIAKKYIRTRTMFRPYPEVGVSVQHVDAITNFVATTTGTLCQPTPINCGTTVSTGTFRPTELARKWSSGIVLGGGVDVRWHHFHIQPELRYTSWLQSAFTGSVQSNQHAAEALIGVTVGK
jgi:opacity protein-like surface antigen